VTTTTPGANNLNPARLNTRKCSKQPSENLRPNSTNWKNLSVKLSLKRESTRNKKIRNKLSTMEQLLSMTLTWALMMRAKGMDRSTLLIVRGRRRMTER
jgi:hypothetical protein